MSKDLMQKLMDLNTRSDSLYEMIHHVKIQTLILPTALKR